MVRCKGNPAKAVLYATVRKFGVLTNTLIKQNRLWLPAHDGQVVESV